MIRLYDKPECPFCFRVRLALGYLGQSYERIPFDDPAREPEWRALTPLQTVPVLVDGDVVLYDSTVMLEYLQDKFGGLLPDGAAQRARMRTLLQYADNPLGRAVRDVIFAKRGVPEEDWDQEKLASAAVAFGQGLPRLEAALGEQRFFGGAFSVADCALTARFALGSAYGLEIPGEFVGLRRWFADRLADPFFAGAAPDVVHRWLVRAA